MKNKIAIFVKKLFYLRNKNDHEKLSF